MRRRADGSVAWPKGPPVDEAGYRAVVRAKLRRQLRWARRAGEDVAEFRQPAAPVARRPRGPRPRPAGPAFDWYTGSTTPSDLKVKGRGSDCVGRRQLHVVATGSRAHVRRMDRLEAAGTNARQRRHYRRVARARARRKAAA